MLICSSGVLKTFAWCRSEAVFLLSVENLSQNIYFFPYCAYRWCWRERPREPHVQWGPPRGGNTFPWSLGHFFLSCFLLINSVVPENFSSNFPNRTDIPGSLKLNPKISLVPSKYMIVFPCFSKPLGGLLQWLLNESYEQASRVVGVKEITSLQEI